MTGSEQSYGRGVVFVLLATLGWSLSGVFVRFLPGLDGWQINTWRGYWMSVGLLAYLVAVYGRSTVDKFREIPLIALIVAAGFFAAGSTFYVTSLTLVGTAAVSVIGASAPVFTGLLSPWTTGEKPGASAWLAALMALAGVSFIARHELSMGNLAGILISLMVPICFAGQTLALRRYRDVDMVPAICLGGFLTFFAAGFLGFLAGHAGGGFDIEPRELLILAAMGPLQLSIPLIFYAKGAKSVPAITLSLIVMLDAVINPLWSWLGAGERPDSSAFIGGAVIISAVLLSIFANVWTTRPQSLASEGR